VGSNDENDKNLRASVRANRMRGPLVIIGIGCLALAAIASVAANAGICLLEARKLSEQDYFRGAINVVIRDPLDGVVENVPGAVILKSVRSQRYADVEVFLTDFPKCCRFVASNFGDTGPELSLFDRLSGVRTVEVSHEKRYEEDGIQKSTPVAAKVAVTSCGQGAPSVSQNSE
jgi:hypothetical protein